MASNRTFAFYRELNNLSTADHFENKKKRKTPDEGPFYEVERVVTRKISKGKVNIFLLLTISCHFSSRIKTIVKA